MPKGISFLLVAISGCLAYSQTIIRGPYLQTPTDNSIIIMWRTNVPTSTKVWYGNSPSSLTNELSINNNVTDHTITITGLSPYSTYYYSVGNLSGSLAGGTLDYRFKTHPVPGTEQPIRVWAIGDFGKGNAGQIDVKNSYMAYPGSSQTDVWMWLGDNAYNDGTDAEYQSKVFALAGFSDIFTWLPFYPSPGNHDYNEVWQESAFLGIPYSNIPLSDHEGPYFDIVDVPELAEAGGYPSNLEVFYSFDYGNVHFLSLNSEVFDFTLTMDRIHEMRDWIIQDLQQNDKLFTIAYFHQPPYSKGSHDSDDLYEQVMKAMREEIIPTLEDYDIDLVVCGHSHVYERSYLIHGHYGYSTTFNASMVMDGSNGNLASNNPYMKDTLYSTPDGTVYVVCGNAGSSESGPALNHPAMVSVDGGSVAMGSFIMDIYKNRLDGKYLKVNGTIGDDFTILKTNLRTDGISDMTICEGDSMVLMATYSGGSDSIDIEWLPSGETSMSIVVNPVVTSSYSYSVTDNLTGQTVSDNFTINVTPLPTPVISYVSGSLVTLTGYSYQWYLNGNPIAGATSNVYNPVVAGDYSVELINGSCANVSTVFTLTSIGLNEISNEINFKLYPNPTFDLLHLSASSDFSVEVYNIMGQLIYQTSKNELNFTISTLEYAPGLYTCKIKCLGVEYWERFVKN